MRILLALDTFQLPVRDPRRAGYGGIEAVVWFLAEELIARGHHVAVLASPGSSVPSGGHLLIHHPSDTADTYHSWIAGADVIHCHDWGRLAQEWAPQFPHKHFVTTWHGEATGAPRHVPPNVTVTGVSPWHSQQIHTTHGYPVRNISNGIALDAYPLYTGRRETAALFLARRVPEKGLHLAVDAAQRSQRPLWVAGPLDAKFHGGAPYLRYMRQRMAALPRGSRDWGEARGHHKVWLLQHARVTVVPHHTFSEPFGLWAVESLACGTPVIGWRRGSIPQVVGSAGMTVTSFAELVRALRDPPRVSPEACRRQAMRWSARRMAQDAETVYHSQSV